MCQRSQSDKVFLETVFFKLTTLFKATQIDKSGSSVIESELGTTVAEQSDLHGEKFKNKVTDDIEAFLQSLDAVTWLFIDCWNKLSLCCLFELGSKALHPVFK